MSLLRGYVPRGYQSAELEKFDSIMILPAGDTQVANNVISSYEDKRLTIAGSQWRLVGLDGTNGNLTFLTPNTNYATISGVVTSGSYTISNVQNISGVVKNTYIIHSGLPSNTAVININYSTSQLTVSQQAIGTASLQSMTMAEIDTNTEVYRPLPRYNSNFGHYYVRSGSLDFRILGAINTTSYDWFSFKQGLDFGPQQFRVSGYVAHGSTDSMVVRYFPTPVKQWGWAVELQNNVANGTRMRLNTDGNYSTLFLCIHNDTASTNGGTSITKNENNIVGSFPDGQVLSGTLAHSSNPNATGTSTKHSANWRGPLKQNDVLRIQNQAAAAEAGVQFWYWEITKV